MKNSKTCINLLPSIFFPPKINWINRHTFFIIFEKKFYTLKKKKKNRIIQIFKILKFVCHSKITGIEICLKNDLIILSELDGAFHLKNGNFFKKFQLFYFSFFLYWLKKDFSRTKIIFGITSSLLSIENRNNIRKDLGLIILNLEEGIFFKIKPINLFNFNQNLICFDKNKNSLIIAIKNEINFIHFNWGGKKIFKSFFYHESAISFLKYYSNFLIFSDKKGQIILAENFSEKNYIFGGEGNNLCAKFFLKKIKISFLNFPFRNILVFNQNFFLLNCTNSPNLIIMNLLKGKKKKISFLQENKNCMEFEFRKKYSPILISTSCFSFFIIDRKKKWRIPIFKNSKPLILSQIFYTFENKNFLKIQSFSLSFFSDEILGITGIGTTLKILNLKKKRKSFRRIKIKKAVIIGNSFEKRKKDFGGQKIYSLSAFGLNFTRLKISTKKKKKTLLGLQFSLDLFRNKIKNFFLDKLGLNFAFLFTNGTIKIFGSKILQGLKVSKEKSLNLKKKNCHIVGFSKKGNLLGMTDSTILAIWKIFPKMLRVQSFNINFQEKIDFLEFLEFGKKEYIVFSSKNEFSTYDLDNNILSRKIKLNIFEIGINEQLNNFFLVTRLISLKENRIKRVFSVFRSICTVPTFLCDLEKISNITHLAYTFLGKKKEKNGFLIIDCLLKIYKISF